MKFMNLKRISSTVLAGAVALSMAAPAFAAAPQTAITAAYNQIRTAVTVPATGRAVINPYGLPFTMGETSVSGQQITTAAPLTIQNRSAVAMKVEASITTTASTGVTLETGYDGTNYADSETGKKLKVQYQAFEAPTVTEANAADTEVLVPLFAALQDGDAVLTADLDTANAATTTGDLILREGNADGELQAGGAAFFRLNGSAARKASWTADDTFTATIAYTFTPDTYALSAGTIAGAGNSNIVDMTGLGTLTITLTPDSNVTGLTNSLDWQWSSSNTAVATVARHSTDNNKAIVSGAAAATDGQKAVITGSVTLNGQLYSTSFEVEINK